MLLRPRNHRLAGVVRVLAQERLLFVLIAMLPVLWFAAPEPRPSLHLLVDWNTIAVLAGLMVLSRSLQDSGFIFQLGRWLLVRLHTERMLAAALVVFAGVLSTVLTNDVALFISVPLTTGLRLVARLPAARLVVFQALAVNAGSALSPVGNPQNLYLWQSSGVGFVEFLVAMAPMAVALIGLLLLSVLIAFRARPVTIAAVGAVPTLHPRTLQTALFLYPVFLVFVEAGHAITAMALIIAAYLVFRPRVLVGVDWLLLGVFILMFVDLGLLALVPSLAMVAGGLAQGPVSTFLAGVGLSQLLSNVPAAILLNQFTGDWQALAWGVNVGGFGLAIGSMANLIALRLAREPGIWKEFHCWSIPMLIFATAAVWWLVNGL